MYQEKLKIDWTTVLLWVGITLFGWLNIYAATYNGEHAGLFDFFYEQLFGWYQCHITSLFSMWGSTIAHKSTAFFGLSKGNATFCHKKIPNC